MQESIYHYKPGEFKHFIQNIDDKSITVTEVIRDWREFKNLNLELKHMTIQQLTDNPKLIEELAKALLTGMKAESKFQLPYNKEERKKELIENISERINITKHEAESKIVIGHYKDPKTWQEFNYCLEVVIAPLNDEDAEDAGFVKIIGNINSSTHIDGGAKYFDGSYFWIDRKGRSMNASNLRGILHECGFKIIMTSKLGETGKDGASWDKYYLTIQQREGEADRFKSPEDPTKILIVVDMLLVGYDVPIVQVMYLDKELREHSLLQAIARVNRPYDKVKTHGLIVDYYGITKNLRKALAMFYEEDIKGVLTPIDKLLNDLNLRHREAMAFFDDIDRKAPELKVNETIIQKFEPSSLRDGFDYAFKMFTKALDAVLPAKEAEPYVNDFKFLGEKRFLIRNEYDAVSTSLRVEGKKVQELIDKYLRSTTIYKLVKEKEITDENFLKYVLSRYKTEKARTALVKNKARQVIGEYASHNPIFFEKLRERLEKIIQEEERRRRIEAQDFDEKPYFDKIKEIYEQALSEEKELKKLGFSSKFEFAVYQELLQVEKDKKISSNITKDIFKQIQNETRIVDWKNKTSSTKNMNIAIYDILSENKIPENKIEGLGSEIIELARRNL